MKTIKIIDLLSRCIKGDKTLPETIKYKNEIYDKKFADYAGHYYYEKREEGEVLLYELNNFIDLKGEVEIIKEEKQEDDFTGVKWFSSGIEVASISNTTTILPILEKLNKNHFHKKQRQLANKINEIIDEINYMNALKKEK